MRLYAASAQAQARTRNQRLRGSSGLRHAVGVEVELLVIPECPGASEASELLRTALTEIGLPDETFTVRIIDTDEAARARRFAGSPAFVVDGTDLFDDAGGRGSLSCRMYPTPNGPKNVPALRDLREALKRRTEGIRRC